MANQLTTKLLQKLVDLRREGDGYIAEYVLAQQLSIGRPQLREVLAKINTFGLIEKKQKYGIRYRPADASTRKILFDLREMLEGYLAENLPSPLNESILDELDFHAQMHARGKEREDSALMAKHDFSFHQTIADAANMPLIGNIMEHLSLLETALYAGEARKDKGCTHNPYTHTEIARAMRRNVREGAELLRKHIRWIAEIDNIENI